MTGLEELIEQLKLLSPASLKEVQMFVDFLKWREEKKDRTAADWSYDFIETFTQAVKYPEDPESGAEIRLGLATCGGEEQAAIFAHPPVAGQTILEYYVPIMQGLRNLQLRFAIGIRDGSRLEDPNLVAFSIRLNGYRVWGTQTNLKRWQNHHVKLVTPPGDIARIEFITEALGDHRWTWAVWGNPILSGKRG
ncbi:MAG: hypothetical protein D6796_08920 [Caldilineae bacterium]|nr:MAG: hypothetical protein D6796_08920 [Caldilineae bacterium]